MYAKQIAAMKAKFNAQREQAKKGGNDVPAGTYLCRLVKAEFRQFDLYDSDKVVGKQLGVMMTWKIVDGEQAGETLWTKGKFGDDEGVLRFMRDLRKLGVDTDTTDVDQALMNYLTQTKPAARLKHEWKDGQRGQYNVTYLQQGVQMDTVDVAQEHIAIADEPDAEPDAEPQPEPAKASNKPSKKATVEPEPEPEPQTSTGDAEPEPEAEGETEWEAGDTAEFKIKGQVRQGFVKSVGEKGGKTVLTIRENGTTTNWPIPTDFPSLRKVTE